MVNYVENGRIKLALLDPESEDEHLTQVLDMIWPEGMGIREAAVFGHNITGFLGLDAPKRNGHAKRAPLPPGPNLFDDGEPDEVPKELAAAQARNDARNGVKPNTALRADGKPRVRAKPDPKNRVKRYISMDEILAVVNAQPEGVTAVQIAQVIAKAEEPERWVIRSVENRIAAAMQSDREGKKPMPFRLDYRPHIGVDGKPTRNLTKYMLPLASTGQG